jgi:hypothetical protein
MTITAWECCEEYADTGKFTTHYDHKRKKWLPIVRVGNRAEQLFGEYDTAEECLFAEESERQQWAEWLTNEHLEGRCGCGAAVEE